MYLRLYDNFFLIYFSKNCELILRKLLNKWRSRWQEEITKSGLAGELDRGWELVRKGKGRKDVSYVFILNKQDGEQTLGDKWIG